MNHIVNEYYWSSWPHEAFQAYHTQPFYFTQEFWTAAATIVALFVPLFVLWLNNRPKRSVLKVRSLSIINQDRANEEFEKFQARVLNVGRLSLTNQGKFTARSVEAYLEEIVFDSESRSDFIPMPLIWTHSPSMKVATSREVYPNQTVYLDIFNHLYDPDYVGDSAVVFAVAGGQGIDSLTRVNLGASTVTIKFYQESGQVLTTRISVTWDGKNTPSMHILD